MKKFVKTFGTPTVMLTSWCVIATGLFMHLIGKNGGLVEVHAHLGILFIIGASMHVFLNFKATKRYLKQGSTYLVLIPIVLVSIVSYIEGMNAEKKEANKTEVQEP